MKTNNASSGDDMHYPAGWEGFTFFCVNIKTINMTNKENFDEFLCIETKVFVPHIILSQDIHTAT